MKPHICSGRLPCEEYGDAVTYCDEDFDHKLWVGNGEYASQVAFCPYCGFEATEKPEVEHD